MLTASSRTAIVIPSEEFAARAGGTIRYQRLIDAAPPGALRMVSLRDLDESDDAYIFSKVYHPIAPALAAHLAARGKPVSLDIFDDYFSEEDDVRLAGYRRWLSQMSAHVNAITVSTDALATRLSPLCRQTPRVVPDPQPSIAPGGVASALAQHPAPDPRRLHFGWFGMASNPLFPVGLRDLAACAGALGSVPGNHRITVLTNLSGADDSALAAMASMPVPVTLLPWTQHAQDDLIAKADAILLPVNAQNFSTAKSLNRAVTALVGGAQVISLGAPLYAALDRFIYRSVSAFAADAARGRLRHNPERIAEFANVLLQHAGAEAAAATFLEAAATSGVSKRPPVAILLGRATPLPETKLALPLLIRAGLNRGPCDADVTLGPKIRLNERAISALPRALRRKVRHGELAAKALGLPAPPPGELPRNPMRAHLHLSARRGAAERLAQALLPDHVIMFADHGGLP